jgi:excisionase family DNA binding protein
MKRLARSNGKLLTLRQAEDYTGLPYATLWTLVDKRQLPRLELPGQRSIYIKRDDLDRFIEDHMTGEPRP